MTDNMRWRYGETNPVVLPVDAATEIHIGDIVYLDGSTVKPASALTPGATKAATQQALHNNFLGVAMQRSRVGDTTPIRVATTGVFELACAAATFTPGALVGVDQAVGATTLVAQQVVAVAAENLAIGRCAKLVNPADTSVLVAIVSTVMYGGPQARA